MRACGPSGVVNLQKLWIYTAEHYPKGVLTGLEDDDIRDLFELGSENHFDTLLKYGFIHRNADKWIEIADWERDQGWVIGAPERSEKAKKASKARWGKSPDEADEIEY